MYIENLSNMQYIFFLQKFKILEKHWNKELRDKWNFDYKLYMFEFFIQDFYFVCRENIKK